MQRCPGKYLNADLIFGGEKDVAKCFVGDGCGAGDGGGGGVITKFYHSNSISL